GDRVLSVENDPTRFIMFVRGDVVVIAGLKIPVAVVSRDGGRNFTTYSDAFTKDSRYITGATVDRCGNIYVSLIPGNGPGGGVYVLEPDAEDFKKFGTGDEYSYTRGLYVDDQRGVLYAATHGESLLWHGIPKCN
ncbi:MAG: hypothetical protein D6780_07975, partial [Candidatus Dadabacteria bacterium]